MYAIRSYYDLWRGDATQTGSHVSVDNLRYNARLWPGAWETIGFVGTTSDGTSAPDEFMLNGIVNYDFWVPEPTLKFPGIEAFLEKYQARAAEVGVDSYNFL